jgi:hypothetical protein
MPGFHDERGNTMDEDDGEEQWIEENFAGLISKEHPQYRIERILFSFIWYDCMAMEADLSGRYTSEACDISGMAWYSAYSYSWLL